VPTACSTRSSPGQITAGSPSTTDTSLTAAVTEQTRNLAASAAELGNEPGRADAIDRDFLEFATRSTRGPDGPAEYAYEYLLVVARKR
jgi:hypothetical protein